LQPSVATRRRKAGRARADEVIVFDSTGIGLQDVAAAVAVYCRALEEKAWRGFSLAAEAVAA